MLLKWFSHVDSSLCQVAYLKPWWGDNTSGKSEGLDVWNLLFKILTRVLITCIGYYNQGVTYPVKDHELASLPSFKSI